MEKVIFDTNAYRYLASGKNWERIDSLIEEIKRKEAKNNIETLMSSVVAMELLAHVASKKDKQYQKCLNAIKAMYLHNGNKDNFQMVASFDLQIARSFFHKDFSKKIETSQAIGQILYHLATKPSPHTFKKFQHNLNRIQKHIKESEEDFVNGMRAIVRIIDPSAVGWRIYEHDDAKRKKALEYIRSEQVSVELAMSWICAVYIHLLMNDEVNVEDKFDFLDMSHELIKHFPEPIILHKQVLENLVNSDFDMAQNNRANFLWDIQLMFIAGDNKMSGDKLYLVTSDDAMKQAANKCGHHLNILTFEEYMDVLG